MNTPPFLLACACALWGMQTGQWLVAAAAAVALEASRVLPLRWNVAQIHFNRLSDFCSALVVAVGGYLYITFGNPHALLLLFQWLPVALLPLALAQAWGNLPRVGPEAFVWTMRKEPDAGRQPFNLAYPYFIVWLLAAATTNARNPAFYVVLVALAAWALWTTRPRRSAPAVWVVLVALAAGGGYVTQKGLARVQGWLEDSVPEWLTASGSRTDPYKSRTDLGHIGDLKHDDAIVLRVRPDGGMRAPLLLHRASYNTYFGTTWVARNAPLAVSLADGSTRWVLGRSGASAARVAIFEHAPRGDPVLSLPLGTTEVIGLKAPEIKRNVLGAVQAQVPPGHFSYIAAVDAGAEPGAPPDDEDLRVPKIEQAALARIALELDLANRSPAQRVAEITKFFARDFGYNTYQAGAFQGATPLADFLTRTRAGHCEYFATAATLLLRAAGIPARYATGFSVQEYSRLEGAYVARVRHAHAWARAYVNGRWIDVDTTPAVWASTEAQASPWWSGLLDLWSWTRFGVSRLATNAREESMTAALWTLIALALAGWLGWRLYRQRNLLVIGGKAASDGRGETVLIGADSEFFLVEGALAQRGLPREPGETVLAWLARIGTKLPTGTERAELTELARLHYRYRFDPAGLARTERERLAQAARSWLARFAAQTAEKQQP